MHSHVKRGNDIKYDFRRGGVRDPPCRDNRHIRGLSHIVTGRVTDRAPTGWFAWKRVLLWFVACCIPIV